MKSFLDTSSLSRRVPPPARVLRLARLTIPLCIIVGWMAEPAARWLVDFLSAFPVPIRI